MAPDADSPCRDLQSGRNPSNPAGAQRGGTMERTAIASHPKFLLSVVETARALNVSRKKLWEITAPRGDLPCIKIGTRVLYSPADIMAWIERQKCQQHPPEIP